MTLNLLTNVSFYIPELIAIATMCALLFMESAYGLSERKRTFVYILGIVGMIVTFISLISLVAKRT